MHQKATNKAQREAWHTTKTCHCTQPWSTTYEHQERKHEQIHKRKLKESKHACIQATMFNNNKRHQESMHKGHKQKLKEKNGTQ
jgi:hypothetical protein